MRYLTPVFLTLDWNPQGFNLFVVFPCALVAGRHKMLGKSDLYHIDISPATTPATEHKISSATALCGTLLSSVTV
jgi:hypothetical protein